MFSIQPGVSKEDVFQKQVCVTSSLTAWLVTSQMSLPVHHILVAVTLNTDCAYIHSHMVMTNLIGQWVPEELARMELGRVLTTLQTHLKVYHAV